MDIFKVMLEKKFSIYKPHSFYWTRTYKSYAFILATVLLILALKFIFKVPESHPAFKSLLIAPILPFVYRIALFFIIRNSYRPLKGKLNGALIFRKDQIEIDNVIYSLNDIKKIEIKGTDWLGAEITYRGLRTYFEDFLSQGVDNTLTLILNDNESIKTYFQKLEACEFREIEDIILNYYLKDKISYLQTVELLCLSSQDEWNRLKELKSK